MKKIVRNLMLSAAALAALVAAPKSNADEFRRGGAREFRDRDFHGRDGHARGFARPPVISYGRRFAAPFRVFAGSRFYSYCPGPGYVFIAGGGWVLPPFYGAVWVPGHYDISGFWVEAYWR